MFFFVICIIKGQLLVDNFLSSFVDLLSLVYLFMLKEVVFVFSCLIVLLFGFSEFVSACGYETERTSVDQRECASGCRSLLLLRAHSWCEFRGHLPQNWHRVQRAKSCRLSVQKYVSTISFSVFSTLGNLTCSKLDFHNF